MKKEVWDNVPTLPTPCQPWTFFVPLIVAVALMEKKNWTVGLKRQRGNSAAKRKKLKMFCPHD